MEVDQIDNANKAISATVTNSSVLQRCLIYLQYFKLEGIAQKLVQNNLVNLDLMSHVLYAFEGGIFEDEDIKNEHKRQLRTTLLQILTKQEFSALSYVLQYYEWDESLILAGQNSTDTATVETHVDGNFSAQQQSQMTEDKNQQSSIPLRDDADLESIMEGLQALQL